MNDDLISRKAAIDELCDNCDNVKAVCAHYPCKQYIAIEHLPTAEPELIRCKDCKHRNAENGFCEGRGWPMQLVPDDGFCDKGGKENR